MTLDNLMITLKWLGAYVGIALFFLGIFCAIVHYDTRKDDEGEEFRKRHDL